MLTSASNLSFKPLSVSTLIPAETSAHVVRLTCIPIEPGELQLTGVSLKMFGGCVDETIYPIQRHLQNPKIYNQGQLIKQTEQQRFGKKELEFSDQPARNDTSMTKKWSLPVNVIPSQSTLELLGTSLGSDQAITLFEGERSELSFTIRNVGSIPVNYLFMKIQDHVVSSEENADVYETQIYQKAIKAFFPLRDTFVGNSLEIDQGFVSKLSWTSDLTPIKLDKVLQPGEQLTIDLGVFGKRDWYL